MKNSIQAVIFAASLTICGQVFASLSSTSSQSESDCIISLIKKVAGQTCYKMSIENGDLQDIKRTALSVNRFSYYGVTSFGEITGEIEAYTIYLSKVFNGKRLKLWSCFLDQSPSYMVKEIFTMNDGYIQLYNLYQPQKMLDGYIRPALAEINSMYCHE